MSFFHSIAVFFQSLVALFAAVHMATTTPPMETLQTVPVAPQTVTEAAQTSSQANVQTTQAAQTTQTNQSTPTAQTSQTTQTKGVISTDVFKTATYTVGLPAKGETTPSTFTMVDGIARISDFTVCDVGNINTYAILAASIDQASGTGVVTMYCNYGASLTSVFLVAFKDLGNKPVQTDVVDLRSHPDLTSRDLFRVDVQDMNLASDGTLSVTALVVPDSLRDAAGADQSATEPVSISYQLNGGKLDPVATLALKDVYAYAQDLDRVNFVKTSGTVVALTQGAILVGDNGSYLNIGCSHASTPVCTQLIPTLRVGDTINIEGAAQYIGTNFSTETLGQEFGLSFSLPDLIADIGLSDPGQITVTSSVQ